MNFDIEVLPGCGNKRIPSLVNSGDGHDVLQHRNAQRKDLFPNLSVFWYYIFQESYV